MRTISRIVTILFVAGIAVLIAAPAAADHDTVTVEVRSISAVPDGDDFDQRLDDIRGRLQRGFEDYSSFRQIDRKSRTITHDGSRNFELPTEDTLTLSYHGRTDEFVRLGLVLEDRFSTTLRATPGSTFFQAGLRYDDSLLILAITVEED